MEDFESLPEFQALIVAATGKPERNMGDSVIAAEVPHWGDVRRMARDIAKTNPDQLALHVFLVKADANVDGFVGFQRSLQAVEELLNEGWDSLFPAPDLDDPDDMYYERVNLLHQLSDQTDILSGQQDFPDTIHRIPLVDVRGVGTFCTRDIDICAGTVVGSEADKDRCQEGLIRGAFAETDIEKLQALATALASVCASCQSIEKIFAHHLGESGVLSLQRLYERVNGCRLRFHEYADEHLQSLVAVNIDEIASSGKDLSNVVDSHFTTQIKTSSLNNRAMVRAAFDAILLFYQDNEPSSPVRVFAYRASEFVDMSFFEILQNLAPDHKDNLPSLLEKLEKQPLVFLFSDSYYRFLAGEALPTITQSAADVIAPKQFEPLDRESPESNVEGESHQQSQELSSSIKQDVGKKYPIPVIDTREQMLDLLQEIETYMIFNEPASPIPLIVGEIRKLVPKGFAELVSVFSRSLPNQTVELSE